MFSPLDWRKKNRQKIRSYKLMYRYGMDLSTYNKRVTDQSGRCAICNENRPLVVDHDHATGAVRGLLCRICNQGLGLFKEKISSLRNAVNYMENSLVRR